MAGRMKKPMKRADEAFSKLVRSRGICESGRQEHKGILQCAHGFSRRYGATRCDERNAFALCSGCHVYYTHRPLEWDEWLRERWGEGLYAEIRSLALSGIRPDWTAEAKRLGGLVKDLELAA